VTGIALSLYALSANVWMPQTVTRNQRQFGFFGIALALVTWFSGAAICVLLGACAGPVLAEDQGPIGRLIRGSSERCSSREQLRFCLHRPVRFVLLTRSVPLTTPRARSREQLSTIPVCRAIHKRITAVPCSLAARMAPRTRNGAHSPAVRPCLRPRPPPTRANKDGASHLRTVMSKKADVRS